MATYSDKTFDTNRYDQARPSYPEEFYQCLIKYHQIDGNQLDTAIDIGCGTGIVTFQLAKYFTNVIGTDPSSTMIEQCNKFVSTRQADPNRIKFMIGSAEQFPPTIKENSCDMITGAECIHWVDHDKFFQAAHRILKPNGTLAYWFYKEPIFIGNEHANQLYDEYCYGEQFMGPYWQQPGKNFLRTLMKEVPVPSDLYHDVQRFEYLVDQSGRPIAMETTPLLIKMTVKLDWWENYIKSWSAYHSWMKDHGHEYDIAERFVQELKQQFSWNDDTEIDLVWDTMYTFARKR